MILLINNFQFNNLVWYFKIWRPSFIRFNFHNKAKTSEIAFLILDTIYTNQLFILVEIISLSPLILKIRIIHIYVLARTILEFDLICPRKSIMCCYCSNCCIRIKVDCFRFVMSHIWFLKNWRTLTIWQDNSHWRYWITSLTISFEFDKWKRDIRFHFSKHIRCWPLKIDRLVWNFLTP